MKRAFVAACFAASLCQAQLSQTGQWSTVRTMPIVAIHQQLLATGKVLMWGRGDLGDYALLWDPIADTYSSVGSEGTDIFCAGHSTLSDGTVLVAGGHIIDGWGLPDTFIFDPFTGSTGTWRRQPNMEEARWYPTLCMMPDGRVLTVSGSISLNPDMSKNWAEAVEVFDPETLTWHTYGHDTSTRGYYRFLHVLPNGGVYYGGPTIYWSRLFDPSTNTWGDFGTPSNEVWGMSSVSYLPGHILKSGGAQNELDPSGSTWAAVFDATAPNPAWKTIEPMAFRRREHDLTVLPDGKVLCTGGSLIFDNPQSAVFEAEMFDPDTEQWTTLPAMQTPRSYHSSAFLRIDGRVVVAGGGNGGGRRQGASQDYMSYELYTPGYLFKGPRPKPSGRPKVAAYGDTFTVKVDQEIAKVCLIAPANVTHGFDQNQRYVPLSFTSANGKVTVTAPANASLAPPGPYMIFFVNNAGVPSWGKFIFIGERLDPIPPDSFTSSVTWDGSLEAITSSDNDYWIASPPEGKDTVLMIKGTCPKRFIGSLQAQIESACTKVPYSIDAYNYEESKWERMASGIETETDYGKTATLAGYASRFVKPDTHEVMLRMTWETSGHPGSNPRVDSVRWRVTK